MLQCGDDEKWVRKSKDPSHDPVYYTQVEVYDIIKRSHIATGHGGRDEMLKVLTAKYIHADITRDAIELYKSQCIECLKKRGHHAIKWVRPIVSTDYRSRGHVDLIEMQSMTSGQ